MSNPRIARTTLLLAASLFLLGAQCGEEFDQLVNAICATNPHLPDCHSIVFVTSTRHDGDLNGLGGADNICNARAAAANLGGRKFVAWLSTTTVDARDRLSEPRGRGFVRPDGEPVATSIADLTDGSILNPIALDENGSMVAGGFLGLLVWTTTKADGTLFHPDFTCSDWKSNSDSDFAVGVGQVNVTNSWWTFRFSGRCDSQFRLYCFEVP